MRISIILSTYNSPAWLEKVLHGYHEQTFPDFEIVIAEDGSDERTSRLLGRMGRELRQPIRHVRQEDLGFRKCAILNRAVLAASGDYLLFSDGDCIPRRDFVEVHHEEARPGHYLSGSYFKLPMAVSEAISPDDIREGRCFDPRWLRGQGLSLWSKTYKIASGPRMGRFLNLLTTTRCNFKGSNASAWKADVLAVNGFDERMAWGGEDREFGERLRNAGIRPRHVRFNAVVVHLDHARGYADPAKREANLRLRKQTEKSGITRTPMGIEREA